ncbi:MULTISPECIES: peptidoglycan-associated lipoprotein Pal [unclassified Gilliamella]|uniref:peptidoglycan-associated lipoprotein Pal n=1 Tax=unclassified Gilliamella TaxID=2685620 RepID=UPI00226A33F6|nr:MULTISPECIES: peptidoglycan-associated lipoprotein Pal [unclassified Gilliamella]MCX8597615.1 peptidoglycan-associated lipoprotein Pal [Gilliamella sp. B3493]MCX8599856.1 peptidoglycan-associated lipoprotein Pal [Gilliamella sp. B3486]MCX8683110.1 peptidoglycan-associated lipoprotein Pal [Gilliamella sp. B2889]MCX8690226.1 peptidoglycan-associated lipoprotein Pal [Gilliamella sp. B2973]MCX8705845.1 peptidoglycan-associated lipoprotein Pal [Gilliamella sp. B3127]
MQFSKFLKVAAVALPLIAVTACSSNSSSKAGNGSLSKEALAQLQKLQQINTVYFDYDKYNVKSEYSTLLNAHSIFMRANSFLNVVIEGHADERGTPEYNIALGERRAGAVKSYLQSNGVSGEQLSIVSYGKEKPAVLGHNEAAYAKNRRAVITYAGY